MITIQKYTAETLTKNAGRENLFGRRSLLAFLFINCYDAWISSCWNSYLAISLIYTSRFGNGISMSFSLSVL